MISLENRPGILRANASFLLAGAGLVALNFAAPYAAAFLLRYMGRMQALCVINLCFYLPFLALPAVLFAGRHGADSLRLNPARLSDVFWCLVMAAVCVFFANGVSALWTILLESLGGTPSGAGLDVQSRDDLLMAIFVMGVLPGVCEELLMRGVVLGAYECGGTRRAVLISASLFALLHASVEGLPVQFLMGVVLGFLAVSTQSLYVGMMLHTAYNSFLVLISFTLGGAANVAGLTETGSMLEIVGGATGVIALGVEAVIAGGILVAILRGVYLRRAREEGLEPVPKSPMPMDGVQIVVLISALVTVAFLYGQDVLSLMGVLQ